jgi:CRP-like cAMP-binding protein
MRPHGLTIETTVKSAGTMRESHLVLLKQVIALGEAGRHGEDRNHGEPLARALGKALQDAMAIIDEQAQTIDVQAREIASLKAVKAAASPPASPPATPSRKLAADVRGLRGRSPGAFDRAVSAAANARGSPSACSFLDFRLWPSTPKRGKSALAASEKAEADAETLITFIGTMSDEVRNDCLANAKVRLFHAGEIIFKEGTMGTAMYFLDSGHATVSISENVVSAVSSGVLLGEGSLLATVRLMITSGTGEEVRGRLLSTMGLANVESFHVMRAVTVTADVPCRCLELNIKTFIQAFKGDLEQMGKTLR